MQGRSGASFPVPAFHTSAVTCVGHRCPRMRGVSSLQSMKMYLCRTCHPPSENVYTRVPPRPPGLRTERVSCTPAGSDHRLQSRASDGGLGSRWGVAGEVGILKWMSHWGLEPGRQAAWLTLKRGEELH